MIHAWVWECAFLNVLGWRYPFVVRKKDKTI